MDNQQTPPLLQTPPVPPSLPPSQPPPKRGLPIIVKIILCCVAAFALFLGWRIWQFVQYARTHGPSPEMAAFRQAADNVGPKGIPASGNSEKARGLAKLMSAAATEIREKGFEQAKKKSILDKNDAFKTYCELRPDRCVFLIHIPEMRRFTSEAQDAWGNATWLLAQSLLSKCDEAKPGMKLAVGLFGLVSYERVLIGELVPDATEQKSGIQEVKRGFGCERELYPWFARPASNAPPANAN